MSLSMPAFAARALWPALVTASVWCAAAASAVFWGFQFPPTWLTPTASVVPVGPTKTQLVGTEDRSTLLRAWGVLPSSPSATISPAQSARYQLLGVVAGASGQGSALIATDGQAPKAYRVGQAVSDGVYLLGLGQRQARMGAAANDPGVWTLTLPALDKTP